MLKTNKLIFIFVFLFLISISLSVVSAADDFDSIQNEVDSGSTNINLGNKTYTSGTVGSINVNKDNIAIKGQSTNFKAVLDANSSNSRIMRISGDNVRLENIIFKNANANIFGGAINSNGANLTIINCDFINNHAMVGAIVLDNSSTDVLIQNCTFINNVAAYSNTSGGGGGGAIDSHSSNCKIMNCTFINNSAISGGGALYFIFGTNNLISGCNFINNSAPIGGVIWTGTTGTTLTITSSSFSNNKVTNNGGAIYSTNTMNINNSNFVDNNAKNYGGAIFNTGTLNIISSSFSNNQANSRITVSVPSFVNCSNIALIKATLIGGNNIKDAIYSNKNILFDSINIVPNDKITNQNIALTVNGKTFNNKTNSQGIATFNINTAGFALKSHTIDINYGGSDSYNSSKNNSSKLLVTQKKIVTISYSPQKYYKKPTKKRYIKVVTKTYKKVKAKVETFYYTIENKKYKLLKKLNTTEIVNKETGSKFDWVLWKKSNSKKYRWNYQAWITKYYYQRNKTTTTNLNGEITTTKILERYTINSEKKIRNDWTKYLEPTLDCNVTNVKIKKVVKSLISQIPKNKRTDTNIANKIWQWTQKKIKYHYDSNGKPYGGTRYGSDGTYSRGGGNCLDHGHLAVAMFRMVGLPAQYKYKVLGSNSAHAWAMVYLKGKWQNADTVIKSGPLRGQKKWVTEKAWNNIEFVKVNYDTHKNLKLSNVWRSVYQKVYYPDGTTSTRYHL